MSDRTCIESGGRVKKSYSAEDIMTCCLECKIDLNPCHGGWHHKAWNFWVKKGVASGGDYGSKEVSKFLQTLALSDLSHGDILRDANPIQKSHTITDLPPVSTNAPTTTTRSPTTKTKSTADSHTNCPKTNDRSAQKSYLTDRSRRLWTCTKTSSATKEVLVSWIKMANVLFCPQVCTNTSTESTSVLTLSKSLGGEKSRERSTGWQPILGDPRGATPMERSKLREGRKSVKSRGK
jgi:hypothetical protein